MTPDDIDRRSIRMHEVAAARLRADPSLLAHARDNIARWRAMDITPWALDAWEEILDGPFEDLLAVMVADTQRMRQLRQCTPFAGTVFIDNRTRWRIIMEFSDAAERRDIAKASLGSAVLLLPQVEAEIHPAILRMQAEKAKHRPLDYSPITEETPPDQWDPCGWTFERWLARVSQAPPGKQAAPPGEGGAIKPETEPPEMSP